MSKKKVVGVLSDIRSLHNVGSIFRTASGAGIQELYLCGITPLPVDRLGNIRGDFKKTALGAEKEVSWKYYSSTKRALNSLKKKGFFICALEQAENSLVYTNVPNQINIALLVGNEVSGISKTILSMSDKIFEIPMHGKKESLNVSVAFGIMAYELKK